MSDVAARPPLRLHTKVSYGLGSVAQGVGTVALSTATINFYLVSVVGLRPAIVGTVILISLVIDAVIDPAIGRWSDTFRSRWGRRHPFMYASAIPIALATALLWRHPVGLTGSAMAAYVLITLIVLRLCSGLYQIPSDALTPELAPDYHERTTLLSYRWFFGVMGALVMGLVLGLFYLRKDKSHPLGQYDPVAYAHFGVTAAIVVFAAIMISSIATHRYIPSLSKAPQGRQPMGAMFREIFSILSNPALLTIMGSGLISGIAGGIGSSISTFMNYYFWGLSPQVAAGLVAFATPAAILGVVLAPILSRALDKKRTMMTVFILSIFVGVVPVSLRLLGVLPPNGSPLIPVILVADLIVAATLGLIGFIIIGSMIADIVEDSAVKTGVRSEGLLFATNGLLPKVTTGLGNLVGNLMLEFVHFPVGQVPTPGHPVEIAPQIMRHLALISLPAGAILNILSVAVLMFYRLDKSSHEANLEAIRLAEQVTEPPTSLVPGAPIIGEGGPF
jgi:Na+/melibiose symporter-like transporter